jgi:hypothetical protein
MEEYEALMVLTNVTLVQIYRTLFNGAVSTTEFI